MGEWWMSLENSQHCFQSWNLFLYSYRRVVSYTADDHQGFVAHVRREPVEGHKIIAQPAVHKVVAQPAIAVQKYVAPAQVYAAPAVHKYVAQPQAYAAPAVQKYVAPAQVYAAPAVQKYVAPAQVYAAPAVQKYIAQPQVYAAPAVHKYVAPAPVVEKYVAPVVKTIQPVAVNAVKYSSADSSAHVAVNGPHYNYHY